MTDELDESGTSPAERTKPTCQEIDALVDIFRCGLGTLIASHDHKADRRLADALSAFLTYHLVGALVDRRGALIPAFFSGASIAPKAAARPSMEPGERRVLEFFHLADLALNTKVFSDAFDDLSVFAEDFLAACNEADTYLLHGFLDSLVLRQPDAVARCLGIDQPADLQAQIADVLAEWGTNAEEAGGDGAAPPTPTPSAGGKSRAEELAKSARGFRRGLKEAKEENGDV